VEFERKQVVAPTAPHKDVTTATLTGRRGGRIIPTPTRTVSKSTFTTVKFGQTKLVSFEGRRKMLASEQLIKDVLGSLDYVDLGKRYHSPLPKELEDAYVYTHNEGHNVFGLIDGAIAHRNDLWKSCKILPVKTALRGYRIHGGWIVVPNDVATCDIGPIAYPTDPNDIEF
jgi:hypothetical protein